MLERLQMISSHAVSAACKFEVSIWFVIVQLLSCCGDLIHKTTSRTFVADIGLDTLIRFRSFICLLPTMALHSQLVPGREVNIVNHIPF